MGDTETKTQRETGERGGQVLPGWIGRALEEGAVGGESSRGRLVRQKEQEKKERWWWWWWWRVLEKCMIEREGEGNTETLYIQAKLTVSQKRKKKITGCPARLLFLVAL